VIRRAARADMFQEIMRAIDSGEGGGEGHFLTPGDKEDCEKANELAR
jgi:hypothetical protein